MAQTSFFGPLSPSASIEGDRLPPRLASRVLPPFDFDCEYAYQESLEDAPR